MTTSQLFEPMSDSEVLEHAYIVTSYFSRESIENELEMAENVPRDVIRVLEKALEVKDA
jgi:hypothetical protein